MKDFEFTIDAKCLSDTSIIGGDIVEIFGYKDSIHFYYAHISNDNHQVHNIIGVANGDDRLPISSVLDDDSKASLRDYDWHKIKITRNVKKGSIKLFIDNMNEPIHSIIDKTLQHGKIGVGSFDDFGKFKNLEIKYNAFPSEINIRKFTEGN